MRSKILRIVAATAALLVGAPVVAHAEIYAWRDASGTLVLSDHPKDKAGQTFAVGTSGYRTTRVSTGRRNSSFDALIEENSSLHGVRPDLVHAVIHAESAFNPMARSVKGAMGLMQLMPATANQFGVTNPYDPVQNIRAGVAYLKRLLQRYSQNEELALAAYNAGPGAVEKYGRVVPPYRETREYVAKIRSRAGVAPSPTRVYKVTENKDGREVVRYTNADPARK